MVKIKIGDVEYDDARANILGKGGFGTVYKGRCCGLDHHGDVIAVKKVNVDHLSMELMEDVLQKLEHDNIVRLFHIERDEDHRYYALEYCEASMEDLFEKPSEPPNAIQSKEKEVLVQSAKGLAHIDSKDIARDLFEKPSKLFTIPEELKPKEKDVLVQLTSGLAHIHSKDIGRGKMVHRDIKPSNVLIKLGGKSATFKWADFGLCKVVSEDKETFTLSSNVRGTLFWIAPEVMEKLDLTDTIKTKGSTKSDIWAAGCLFFYYLTKGQHPFGVAKESVLDVTVKNIKDGYPVNINELKFDNFARETIVKMIQREPDDRIKARDIIIDLEHPVERKISYDQKARCLNSSDFFTTDMCTFIGKFNKVTDVAVKRIELDKADPDLGYKFSQLNHPNVVKLLFAERDDLFAYFAFELCAGSLDQLFLNDDHPKKYRGNSLPPDGQVLTSLIEGLQYIHSQGLVHGRIHNEKVLISSTEPVVVKWGHFGLIKDPRAENYNVHAPEMEMYIPEPSEMDDDMVENKVDGIMTMTKESDIWAAGAVFYYYLLPREEDTLYSLTNPIIALASQSEIQRSFKHITSPYAEVVRQMLATNPVDRIQLDRALDLVNQRMNQAKSFQQLCNESADSSTDEERFQQYLQEGIDIDGFDIAKRDIDKEIQRTYLSQICIGLSKGQTNNRPRIEWLLESYRKQSKRPKNDSDGTNGLYWLFQIKSNGLLDLVEEMIDIGIDLSVKDRNGRTILHSMCENYTSPDLLEMIQKIIKNSKKGIINLKDSSKRTALHFLCENYQNGNLAQIIQFMIDNRVDVGAEDEFQNTALHWLCEKYSHHDLMNIIELLMERGANVKAKDYNGITILHRFSANSKHENVKEIVDFLIKKGVDLNDSGPEGESTLHAFCQNYRKEDLIDIIKSLVKNGVKVNAKNDNGDSALDYICECYRNENLKEIIEYMISTGFDIRSNITGGKTALHWLCEDYHCDNLYNIIKLLIDEKGLNVKVKDSEGCTALDWLRKNDRLKLDVKDKVATLLISKYENPSTLSNEEEIEMWELCSSASVTEEGADRLCDLFYRRKNLNSFDAENGLTTLSLLCKSGAPGEQRLRAIRSFLKTYKARAVRPANDSDGTNALFWLFQNPEITESLSESVKEMIEIGTEVNVRDSTKRTTFHSICANYRNKDLPKIIEMMMKKRVYVHVKDSNQRTPLHWLSQSYKNDNLLDIFKYLVENADDLLLDGKDSEEKTVLHLLCANYRNENLFDIVKLLIDYYDVHLNVVDLNGKTALHYLRENYTKGNLEDIAKLLTGGSNQSYDNDDKKVQHEQKLLIEPTNILLDNNHQVKLSLFQSILTRLNSISYEWIIISLLCLIIAILLYKLNAV